jgi:hypothetical protein
MAATQAENWEVLLPGSVAVAVTNWPGGTSPGKSAVKTATPSAPVVTVSAPSNVSPSPKPDASQAVLLKNSRV